MLRDVLVACLFGVLEGVTEWLPISSTGHLILLEDILSFPAREEVFDLFEVLIQLGAILAVAVLYWHRLNPFSRRKTPEERQGTFALWGKVALAVIPSVLAGLLLDDFLSAHLYRPAVVAGALIFYGALFLLPERKKGVKTLHVEALSPKTAFFVGCFQVLSLVPGTSRSGSTILGGITLGLTRPAAAEFSFFLGIPTMLGAGLLKSVKFCRAGLSLTSREALLLASGTLCAFLVSLAAIRFLLDFVRRHSFAAFGVYRILLGIAVLARIIFI